MRRKKKKLFKASQIRMFLIVVFVIGLIFTATPYFIYKNLSEPVAVNNKTEHIVVIPKGSSTDKIANILKKEKLIKNVEIFKLYCKYYKFDGKFKAGKFSLNQSMSTGIIAKQLILGNAKVGVIKVTIPEGYELRMIAKKFGESGLCSAADFLKAANSKNYNFDFVKNMPKRNNQLEGYLFPDTYEFYKDVTPEGIVNRMLSRFSDVYNSKFKLEEKKRKLSTDKVIIMASIIEREAKMDNERKRISGVFYNRIKESIRLQSCATIQYVLKERKAVLSFKDTHLDSPYNTYQKDGLPPGPIASPGIKSIEAALYPEKTDYLYFVAKNDGSSVFTKTYAEHLAAQARIKSGN